MLIDLPRFELEERLYSENEPVESNSVDFLIHGIREKLGADVIKNMGGGDEWWRGQSKTACIDGSPTVLFANHVGPHRGAIYSGA